jgi:hypothetical protein
MYANCVSSKHHGQAASDMNEKKKKESRAPHTHAPVQQLHRELHRPAAARPQPPL